MRPLLLLVLLLGGPIARAQSAVAAPPYPVIFVHGWNSSDLTWTTTVDYLEGRGWGTPYTYHADLNGSTSTAYQNDLYMADPVPFWDFAPRTPGGDSTGAAAGVPYAEAARRLGGPLAGRGGTDSHLFLTNFETYYSASTNQIYVHDVRDQSGQSNSNCAAITKQAVALAVVIEDVLAWTGAPRVILMGHSMGGLAIREYLQRRAPNGQAMWWVEPGVSGGHHVAAAVTMGTPHQGSNTWEFGVTGCSDSEGLRDMRYSYLSTGEWGRFLYGGAEDVWAVWDNDDVNADGDDDDTIAGLNQGTPSSVYSRDNPAHPLPLDVAYTYVYATNDLIVDADRARPQYRDAGGTVRLAPDNGPRLVQNNVAHWNQTAAYAAIEAALLGAVQTTTATAPAPEGVAVQVAPNPASGPVAVTLTLPAAGTVAYRVVDALGRTVYAGAPTLQAAGTATTVLDAGALAPGAYVLQTVIDGAPQAPVRFSVVR